MKKGEKTRMPMMIFAVVAAIILIIAVPIVTSLNYQVNSYPYAAELSKPGLGVDITNSSLPIPIQAGRREV